MLQGLISRISWSVSWKSERWILTKSTERDHVLNAWNLELIKALDDEYFAMCKFLLERCHARKDQTLETTLYVLIYGSWFEISWFKWVSSWHSGAWRCSMFFIVFAFATIWRYHWSSLHFFPVLWASPSVFLSVSMCICGALQSSTVYLCAGGQRWQCLGGRLHNKLPGWARQRGQTGHLSDEIRCPGCPPVDAPARWWGPWLC